METMKMENADECCMEVDSSSDRNESREHKHEIKESPIIFCSQGK